ncbi:MAG: IS1595 family transposase [Agitococcus sp.]|nr:IS1595 family transposase [Agitococcus sp.]
MRIAEFNQMLKDVSILSTKQFELLLRTLEIRRQQKQALQVIEAVHLGEGCPHYHSPSIVKYGLVRGLQRYRCKTCLRTFNAATGTPLSRLRHKERFLQQGQCMAQGQSIREAARALGVAVSTAFRLRHRFLAAVGAHQPAQVAGLLEADETYFRESQKGIRFLLKPGSEAHQRPARHRGGKAKKVVQRDLVPVLVGRLRGQHHVADRVLTAMTAVQATDALRAWVGPDTLLCTDGSGSLRKAAKTLGITSKSIAVGYDGRVSEGVYHVQSVNNYHERLKTWINRRLRGVATKYLPHYLAWMRVQEWFKNELRPEHFVISGLGKQIINT